MTPSDEPDETDETEGEVRSSTVDAWPWFEERVVGPASDLLSLLAVGEDLVDQERCRSLEVGIEGLFRSEVASQYLGWPPESTTDGSRVDLCRCSGAGRLEAFGVSWIDFEGSVFPFRAEIAVPADRSTSVSVTVSIGGVDPDSGAPPRLPNGTIFVPVRDEHDRPVAPELIVGRHQVAVAWTKAFELPRRD